MLFACSRSDRPPAPSFAAIFPPATGALMNESSPALADLDGDGVPDIVFGSGVDRTRPAGRRLVFTGQPAVSGYVVAVSGRTNRILWQVPNPRDAFTTPRFAYLDHDRVPDVVMGGREGVLTAYAGTDGHVLWRVLGEDVVATPFPYYFLTPAIVPDVNGDGVPDVVDTYGGNDTRAPRDARDAGYVMVVSGADGRVLRAQRVPDGAETYASPLAYRRRDGSTWVIFGTGGETKPGAEWRAPLASLVDSTLATRAERLVLEGTKGVIAPPTLVDLTGDGEQDVLVNTFDGRLVAVDGATAKPLWSHADSSEESYHQPAVVRLTRDGGRLGLFVSRGIGAFPRYVGTVHRLYDAATGRVLYEYRDPNYPAGAPLAVDLTGDGVDEPVFFTQRFPAAQGSRIHVLHLPTHRLASHDVPDNLWSTPVVADPRRTGTLELIGVSWRMGPNGIASLPDVQWQLLRLDLSAKTPSAITWGGYMGTTADGRYHAGDLTRSRGARGEHQ
ncbi:FG-GAP repeat protein (plasmid) [Gemmatirosa kalamazoonensis]|uniref:FG-GAP repeat protein n=1 Tax=Gemmatirosa kalamazoonensis TaxID=861299 RepID=W0RNS6_9BACT|nr:PQQ-binding-like beta-propeller repeat protein [Gemmatirosa kalamazoonensis]AHG92391.1 FG-GAP repeat protein [Gemmatirosa kalamazoonensis]